MKVEDIEGVEMTEAMVNDRPARQVTCPTCGMSASPSDHRLLVPQENAAQDDMSVDLRTCRNCGGTIRI